MKQTLSLKLGQQLTMTPQLQQAIKLLQLSALDLQQEIQTTLESNPMLEYEGDVGVEDDSEASADSELDDLAAPEATPQNLEDPMGGDLATDDFAAGSDDVATEDVASLPDGIGDDLPVDSSWEDVYPTTSSLPATDNDFDPLANRTAPTTLADHMVWQLNLTPMAPSDQVIAMSIIDALDSNGLLAQSTEEIWRGLVGEQSDEDASVDVDVDQISHDDVCAVLERLQAFDPLGVAARDLQECLLLQLKPLHEDTPWLDEATTLITDHLDLLGAKDFTTLRRRTKLSDAELAQVVDLIRTLNPRPGNAIEEAATDYIVPDVVVKKDEGRWVVELNSETAPRVRVNPLYENMAREMAKGADREYMRDNLQEARWFLKSLQTRHDTLLRVATKIVEVQRGFLDYGPEAMKPLILADIAEAVDLHESTISRVTSRKYMATPRGVYELKYFFSSHVGTATGGEVSSTAIRALIQKLTADEDRRKPLSDSKIAAILKDQNINVARRTVAKYRESLSIPPSNERKQLA